MKPPKMKNLKNFDADEIPEFSTEQICQRAREIYRARGGMMGMTLNDWLLAEQQLKRAFAKTN